MPSYFQILSPSGLFARIGMSSSGIDHRTDVSEGGTSLREGARGLNRFRSKLSGRWPLLLSARRDPAASGGAQRHPQPKITLGSPLTATGCRNISFALTGREC